MSNEFSPFSAASFVVDVIRPLAIRFETARRDRCIWRERWSLAEIVEARRFLLIGRALGHFDSDACAKILHAYAKLFNSASEDNAGLKAEFEGILEVAEESLRALEPLATANLSGGKLRSASRATGLLQVSILASSRLGHGLAGEAQAQLLFGNHADCLKVLGDFAASALGDRRRQRQLRRRLQSPMEDAQHALRDAPGPTLAASMFHAIQYMWTQVYSHDYRGIGLTDLAPTIDPLESQIGNSTGELLHLAQYWRLNFLNDLFEQNFFTALTFAATALFQQDSLSADSDFSSNANEFAANVVARTRRVSRAWSSVFADSLAVAG